MSKDNLLLRALRMNAYFSGISSLALLSAAPWLAAQLGLGGSLPVYAVAVLLALFALQLARIVRSRDIKTLEVAGIIGSDIAWVVASAVLVALYYPSMTAIGIVLVESVALVVLFFAIQQLRGLRVVRKSGPVRAAS